MTAAGSPLQQALRLHQAGDTAAAEGLYRGVLARQPDQPDALYLLGALCLGAGRSAEAAALLGRALNVRPDWPDAMLQRARALLATGDNAGVAALLAGSDLPDALHLRGIALARLGRPAEAIALQDRLLALRPAYANAWFERGLALANQGDAIAAIESFDRCLAIRPEHGFAWTNRGIELARLQHAPEAVASHERAVALRPDDAAARLNLGLARLLAGDVGGWADYEARLRLSKTLPPQPRWRGEPLAGRRVLLHAEQGLGDTLQFCRFAPLVAAHGGPVVLRVQAPLLPLLRGLAGLERVVAEDGDSSDCDLACPLLSLPLVLGHPPVAVPYLPAAAAKRGGRRRIGLAWAGNPAHPNDAHRSVPVAALAPLLALDVEWHSLLPDLAPPTGVQRHALTDFAATAALVAGLDAVVSVDTAVAHLAGGMGRPLHLLLPFFGVDWRWGLQRPDTPWYPTARLQRQAKGEDWSATVLRLAAVLAAG